MADRQGPGDALAGLSSLLEAVSDHAIVRLDTTGAILTWSGPAAAMFGWAPQEILTRNFARLLAPEGRADTAARLARAAGGEHTEVAEDCCRNDGTRLSAITSLAAIHDAGGGLQGYWLVVRNTSAAREAARAIEASGTVLKSILATVPDAMIVIDDLGIIESFSTAAETVFGYTEAEIVGRNVAVLMPFPDREMHDAYMAHYRTTGEKRIIGTSRRVLGQRKNGTTFPHTLRIAEATGGGRRVFTGFLRDLTQQEADAARLAELQAELLHISRLTAMGTMASTLAHELNQPVTAVANYVETSLALLDAGGADRTVLSEALAEAAAEAHRAGKIVRRLRDFFARGELDKTIEALPDLVDDACALGMIGAANHGIVVERDIAPAAGSVLVDRVQIQQVLINLMRNAAEAISPERPGIVRIAAQPRGDLAHITVSDNGSGLEPGVAEQLFSAFVTTKRDGMGLGLSICRTIVEAHGGRIWAEARPVGTAFHFTLPRVKESGDD